MIKTDEWWNEIKENRCINKLNEGLQSFLYIYQPISA